MTDKPKRLLLDKDGNPVLNKFGHTITAKLTNEDKNAIDKMLAEGSTKTAVMSELNITVGRLNQYLEKTATAQRIALLSIPMMAQEVKGLKEEISQLVQIVAHIEARQSDTQTGVKKLQSQTYRNRIGREKTERTARSQRQELNRLRRLLQGRKGPTF